MTTFHFFTAIILLASAAVCAENAKESSPSLATKTPFIVTSADTTTTPSALTGNIQIQGRQLLVDGTPFVIKAVCYSPIPKGKSARNKSDVILLHPTASDLVLIEGDFKMMQAAGINTIRTYFPITDQRILDLLVKYHLKTIVPIFNSLVFIPFSEITKRVAEIASVLKNHPSTLIWEVGNEWNYNNFYSEETNAPNAHPSLELLKTAIASVRSQDTVHPISTVLGDLPKEELFWKSLPDAQIDLYGSNIYDGLTFGDRLNRWKKISSKPLYISEFGANAFNDITHREDDQAQATALKSLLTEIQNNLSEKNRDNVLVGGAIFEFCDEWWKGGGSPLAHEANGFYLILDKKGLPKLRSYPSDLAYDKNIPKISGPYPDQIFHEKWWGIVDIDRHKRPAYQVVKKIYTQ